MSTRRNFLKTLSGMALLTVVPRHVLGGPNHVAPSDQLTKGIIGVGGIGKSSYHFTSTKECRLVAVCDVDSKHLQSALDLGKKRFNETLQSYRDFRRLIADPNVDIVHIATPPHWHGIMAVEAARAGKDIWCEKPMTRTIGESRRVVEAVKRNNRIFRLNTWFRFKDTFYGLGTTVEPLKKLVDSGMLGWPLKVTISGATGFAWKFYWVGKENLVPQRVPSNLDYDMWLGPAPLQALQRTPRAPDFPRLLGLRRRRPYGHGAALHGPRTVSAGQGPYVAREGRGRRPRTAPRRRGHLAQDRLHLRRRLPDRTRRRGLRKRRRHALHRRPAGQGLQRVPLHDSRCHGEAGRDCPIPSRRTPTFWNASARGAGLRSTNRSVTAARRS